MFTPTPWKHWLAVAVCSVPVIVLITWSIYMTFLHWEAVAVFTGIFAAIVTLSWSVGYLINYGFPWSTK